MSNVVSIGISRHASLAQRQGSLLENFAQHRRGRSDVFWLKENAELLSILLTSKAKLLPDALQVYVPFYETLEERMRFFPQYYRFLLSMCLDLEDLGMPGDTGARMCDWVGAHNLVDAELSDLQRAESRRLLMRRADIKPDKLLDARLRRFVECCDTFTLPNKKAAYELTHIVFYLSDYGRVDPNLSGKAAISLEYAGLLAYLDQDVDLLSEVCIAMRFAGQLPSAIWENWLEHALGDFHLVPHSADPLPDAYHEYLVTSWWASLAGHEGFAGKPIKGGMHVHRTGSSRGPLRTISEFMYHLGPGRSADWSKMRHQFEHLLASDEQEILAGAAQSSDRFDAFFQGFSRAD